MCVWWGLTNSKQEGAAVTTPFNILQFSISDDSITLLIRVGSKRDGCNHLAIQGGGDLGFLTTSGDLVVGMRYLLIYIHHRDEAPKPT